MGDQPQQKGMLSRRDVAARLGISTSSVRRLEYDKLQPTLDDAGVWRFDPSEVDALDPASVRVRRATPRSVGNDELRALARKGRLAARVFRMFARSASLSQIVVAMKQPPEVIRDLYREWLTGLDDGEWARRDADDER